MSIYSGVKLFGQNHQKEPNRKNRNVDRKNRKGGIVMSTKKLPKDLPKVFHRFEITIRKKVSLKQLNDILITALEGGSNYWYNLSNISNVKKYQRKYYPEVHGEEEFFWGTFVEAILPAILHGEIIEVEDIETEELLGVLSNERLRKGIEAFVEDGRYSTDFLFDEEADYDAGDADIVLQFIVMGEVVYG